MNKRRQTAKIAKKTGTFVLASYVPGFFKIHLRYIKNNVRVWAVFFVAPFLVIKLCLSTVFGWFGAKGSGGWAFDLIAIFLIALCFYMAERHEQFRRFYIHAAPAITGLGLFYWMGQQTGYLNPGYAVIAVLIWLFTVRVWRFSTTRGLQALRDGGDKTYAKARGFYEMGQYDKAMPLLEKSAAKGNFRSLYLLGEAHETGLYYDRDILKAADFYFQSGKKGWRPGREKFKTLFDSLPPAQQKQLEQDMLVSWLD